MAVKNQPIASATGQQSPEAAAQAATIKLERIACSFGRVLSALRSAFPDTKYLTQDGESEALQLIAHGKGELTALRDALYHRLSVGVHVPTPSVPLPKSETTPEVTPEAAPKPFRYASKVASAMSLTYKQGQILNSLSQMAEGRVNDDPVTYVVPANSEGQTACRHMEGLGLLHFKGLYKGDYVYCLTPAAALLLRVPLSVAYLPPTVYSTTPKIAPNPNL